MITPFSYPTVPAHWFFFTTVTDAITKWGLHIPCGLSMMDYPETCWKPPETGRGGFQIIHHWRISRYGFTTVCTVRGALSFWLQKYRWFYICYFISHTFCLCPSIGSFRILKEIKVSPHALRCNSKVMPNRVNVLPWAISWTWIEDIFSVVSKLKRKLF